MNQERISIETIQKCQLSDTTYSKQWFMKLLTDNISNEQFNRFCREIAHLNERFDTTIGLFATDRPDLIEDKNLMFELDDIDFDRPVTFKKITS